MKFSFFVLKKNIYILHGRVFVMILDCSLTTNECKLFHVPCITHYENTPMQYTENFLLLIFAQNIDCGYTLEPHHRGGSNEYPF